MAPLQLARRRMARSGVALALLGGAIGVLSVVPSAVVSSVAGASTSGTIYVASAVSDTLTTYPDPPASSVPSATLNSSASLEVPEATAFDHAGNLWVANEGTNSLVEFTPSELASSGSPIPAVILSPASNSIDGPSQFAFDGSGNLWLANEGSSTVDEFAASQLAASGNPTPIVTLTVPAARLGELSGLAFDASGDLWLTDGSPGVDLNGVVLELAKADIATSGAPTPERSISEPGVGDRSVYLAFDSSGDLWISDSSNLTIIEYSASQLLPTGLGGPIVTISGVNAVGLAFDHSGDLWFTANNPVSVGEFTPGQLAVSGTPSPNVLITSPAFREEGAGQPTFDGAGDLWVPDSFHTSSSDTTVGKFAASQLLTSGMATPSVTLSSTLGLNQPNNVALDAAGDVWVSNNLDQTMSEFSPGQVTTSGDPAPKVSLSGLGTAFAFDGAGDLWAVDQRGLDEYTPAAIATTGSPAAVVNISSIGANFPAAAIAFDATGDLWLIGSTTPVIDEFTPAQLSTTGSPAPTVSITVSGLPSFVPQGLAFDASGDMWIGAGNRVVELAKSQLTTSGSLTANMVIPGFVTAHGLAFDSAGDLWVTDGALNAVEEFAPSQLTPGGSSEPIDQIDGSTSGLDSPAGIAIASAPAVSATPTTTTASVSSSTVTSGSTVTYSATVAPATPSDNLLTGSVIFSTGSTVLCDTPDLVSGTASCAASDAPVGSDEVVASYSGSPLFDPSTTVVTLVVTDGSATGSPPPTNSSQGYWLVARDGGIFSFNRPFDGSAGGIALAQPIVGMAETGDGGGYWFVARDGGVFAYGDAGYQGSVPELGTHVNDVVGMVADHATGGYWIIGADGTVWDFGAPQVGDLPIFGFHVNDIVGGAATPDGAGLYLVGANGRVYNLLGGAHSQGDVSGIGLNAPIVSMTIDPVTGGYWLLGRDGGVFSFNAPFFGSTGNLSLNQPVVGMAASADGQGYWFVASDGGVFSYGDAVFHGSTGNIVLNQPVVGIGGS